VISLCAFNGVHLATAGLVCEETVYNTNLVRAVQRKLRDARIGNVPVDGKWGDRTTKLLQKYQKTKKLSTSGELDEPTFRALFGGEQTYQPVSEIVKNPHHAPDDIYSKYCKGEL
jgi:peptidoglycan hydrolase-like protein with peptidoglycan-binding domain